MKKSEIERHIRNAGRLINETMDSWETASFRDAMVAISMHPERHVDDIHKLGNILGRISTNGPGHIPKKRIFV